MRIRLLLVGVGVLILVASLVGGAGRARAAGPCDAWMDSSKTPDQRAHALLAAMTLDDEIAMVHEGQTIWTDYGVAGNIAANPNLCIPDVRLNDAGQGVGDMVTGTTAFPAPIAQAASWDRALQSRFGDRLGWEASQKGIAVQLAPGLNIARTPLNGRNWEYMGEDPYLSGQTAAAEVAGIQSEHVVATLKHYAFNNHEVNRNTVSADVDPRTAHEIYLPAFETAVEQGHAGAVMCSYNRINSVYACENPTLLDTWLKGEFGFDGFVMSDWGATHSTVASANAGLDLDMDGSTGTFFNAALKTAVQNGDVPKARLDDMVVRILRTLFRVGVFDNPPAAEPAAAAADVVTPEELQTARDVAEGGTVLLKNDGGALPISGMLKKIAVIGKAAAPDGAALVYNGNGSGHIPEFGTKADVVSPLQAIESRAALATDAVTYSDGSVIQDAVAAASAADVAIVWAYDVSGEGTDLPSLDLDQTTGTCTVLSGCSYQSSNQNELISAVAAANPNTIVVLNTAGPVLMPWAGRVKSIVESWYPGQEDGNAIAPILFGDVNPSGKLPQTFPQSQADLPATTPAQYPGVTVPGDSVGAHASYSEGLLVGYRWFDAKGIQPLFCFGHGLSYTTFGYSGLAVSPTADGASATFTVTNTGGRSGAEVAQVYVGFPSAAGEPPEQLKGYAKVFLAAGQSQQVTVPLDARAFSHWDGTNGWTIAPGTYHVSVGSSSCDLRLGTDLVLPRIADLAVAGAGSPSPVKRGKLVTYTFAVRNAGPLSASEVTLGDRVPQGASYQAATASQGVCGLSSGTVTCALGTLAAGASATVTIVVKATAAGTLADTASVGAGSPPDPNAANNTATVTTTVT